MVTSYEYEAPVNIKLLLDFCDNIKTLKRVQKSHKAI